MSIRSTLLLAGAATLAFSTPALAQYDEPEIEWVEHAGPEGTYDGDWEGEWQDEVTYRGTWDGTYTDDAAYEGDHRYEMRHERHGLSASPDGRLGYTLQEREAWLADCRYVMSGGSDYGYYDDRDGNGALVGGLLGAVVGGVAGNRIADGDRLLGTVVGAGLGGLAGAAIGSAVDGDGRRGRELSADEVYAARYCDAYLRRYEMSGGAGYGYAQPVMMVQMVGAGHGQRGHRHGPDCTTTVREEWVEVEAPAPAPRRARRVVAPRPAAAPAPSGKLLPAE